MGKELIEIRSENGVETVSARELHEKLGIKSQFTHWFDKMCEYGFEENADYVLVSQKKLTNNPKNPETEIKEYFISLDMAKEICMIQRSEIGRKFRQYFIECEKELNEKPKAKEISDTERRFGMYDRLHALADKYEPKNESYSQILDAYATKELTGEFLLPLPKLEEKNYSATEVGEMLGISKNAVGKIAKRLGIKTDGEFGKWYVDKSPFSNKEVNTFRYSGKAVDLIRKEV